MNKKRIYTIIAAGFLIIFLHYIGFLPVIESYIIKILAPVESRFFYLGNKLNLNYEEKNISKRELIADNQKLKEENIKLLEENAKLKILADENNILREQLNFYSQKQYQKVTANIISKGEGLTANQIITLDRGASDGIKVGQAVIFGQGHMVGKIFAAENQISYCYLITDRRSLTAASISGKPTIDGLIKGELGLTMRIDYIPQQIEEQIDINDIIITSGLEPSIPKGLIIGKVQEVIKEDNDLFQTAIINPVTDLNSLSIVSVIIY